MYTCREKAYMICINLMLFAKIECKCKNTAIAIVDASEDASRGCGRRIGRQRRGDIRTVEQNMRRDIIWTVHTVYRYSKWWEIECSEERSYAHHCIHVLKTHTLIYKSGPTSSRKLTKFLVKTGRQLSRTLDWYKSYVAFYCTSLNL